MTDLSDLKMLLDFDNPGESEQVLRDLLTHQQDDLNAELTLMTQIARAQGLQANFAGGHETLDEVERRLTDETPAARVRALLERGRLYNSAGDKEKARPYFEQAWEQGQEINELGLAVDAGHMLGIVEAPDIDWSLKAIELAENTNNEEARYWLPRLYNNIGWTYHERGDFENALVAFQKALRLFEQQEDPIRTRRARWAVARTLRSLERYSDAHAVQSQLQDEGAVDGFVEEELGECLLALGRGDEAKPHFERAYSILSQDEWLVQNEPDRVKRLRSLAEDE